MTFRLLSIAEEDLAEATRFYETQAAGLGHEFLDEFEAAVARACQFPEGWRIISRRHRRCLFRRFPFAVLYTVDEGVLVVAGVMDLRMDPERQRQRAIDT